MPDHHDEARSLRAEPVAGDSTAARAAPSLEPYRDSSRLVSGEVTLLDLAEVLARRWRVLLGTPLCAMLLIAALSFLIPPSYTASVMFVPESRPQLRLPSGLSGLAGQLGVSLGQEGSQSPRFYAEVVRSREIIDQVIGDRYPDPRAGAARASDSVTLLDLLGVKGSTLADRLDKGARVLRRRVDAKVDDQTAIVELSVDARYPTLAAEVANKFIAHLNEFNAQKRRSQAGERRKFAEERVAESEAELRSAEQALREFYERNRSWQQSPGLVFEEGRLRRQVELEQELYLTLRREYETARIEEVNDIPVITVIDPPAVPQHRSGPRRWLMLALAGLFGAATGVIWVVGGEFLRAAMGRGHLLQQETRQQELSAFGRP